MATPKKNNGWWKIRNNCKLTVETVTKIADTVDEGASGRIRGAGANNGALVGRVQKGKAPHTDEH